MIKYRACWIDKAGKIQLGVLTRFKSVAETEMLFKRSLGFSAWLQDHENNRVD